MFLATLTDDRMRRSQVLFVLLVLFTLFSTLTWTEWRNGKVILEWESAIELDIASFLIYRRSEMETGKDYVLIREANVYRDSSPFTSSYYQMVDAGLVAGETYWYKMGLLALDGEKTEIGPISARASGNILIVLPLAIFSGIALICLFPWRYLLPRRKAQLIILLLPIVGSLFVLVNVRAAITLLYLNAISQTNGIFIEWGTAAEVDLAGYYVQRSTQSDSGFQRINSNLIAATGGTLSGATYNYLDSSVTSGTTYYYRLEAVTNNQTSQFFGPVSSSGNGQTTPSASLSPTQTRTRTVTPSGTRTSTAPPPTWTPTDTSTPTITPTNTITPIPSLTFSPTADLFFGATITPFIPGETATPGPSVTPVLIALATPDLTQEALQTPDLTRPTDRRDWIRIGFLIAVGGFWLLLGVWLYAYITKINR